MKIKYTPNFTTLDSDKNPVKCSCGNPSERIALAKGGMWASCPECYKQNPESGTFLPSGPADNPIEYHLVAL